MRSVTDARTGEISIHALRVEGDNKDLIRAKLEQIISIHALRVEGDLYDQRKLPG